MTETITSKIEALLFQLHCFDEADSSEILNQVKVMVKEGQQALLKELEAGLSEQNELLIAWIERQPSFLKEMKKKLKAVEKEAAKDFEVEEKEGAEAILNEL